MSLISYARVEHRAERGARIDGYDTALRFAPAPFSFANGSQSLACGLWSPICLTELLTHGQTNLLTISWLVCSMFYFSESLLSQFQQTEATRPHVFIFQPTHKYAKAWHGHRLLTMGRKLDAMMLYLIKNGVQIPNLTVSHL